MTWAEIRSTASKFVHRQDIPWPELQPLTCADISIALAVQENEATAIIPLSGPDGKFLYSGALPADYAAMRSVTLGTRTIDPVDIKTLGELAGNWYAISGGMIYAQAAGDCGIVYSQRVEPLASDSDSNVILDRYPNIYLYGLLKHAAIYCQDEEINTAFFERQFLSAIQTANSAYVDATFGPGMMQVAGGARRF